ncbi:MAG: GNAT family N-acetyltransferase [Flavobacteriales bacterium]|nr:GNAT family N-acetyltransferase [Flavobacteriales bacterium]
MDKVSIHIRTATRNDAALLCDLGRITFIEAYAAQNSKDDMALYLTENFTAEKISDEFNEENGVCFIAEVNGESCGYAKLRCKESLAELHSSKHIELARIYVLEKFQQQKIGKRLLEKCIEQSHALGYEILWLGVWKKNEKAIEFYARNGFTIFGEHVFQFGNDPQVDWMMKYNLNLSRQ